ncbi:MAG: alpha/beta hydrolase [Nakamurella sp.]
MTRRITTNDGVELAVLDEGTGPVFVLVAGYTAAAATWVFQTEALVTAGFRVVAVDRRSHGDSDRPASGQRISRHAKDLDDVLITLSISDAVLVGGSMGASCLWSYLDLFGSRRVRGVVTIDQTPKMINDDDWPHGFYGFTNDNAGRLFEHGVPQTGRGRSVEASMPALLRLSDKLGGAGLRGDVAPETLALLRDHAQQDWRDVISGVDVPQLLIAGRQSQVWPCEHAAAAVAGNALARALVIEDSGHAVNIDQPEQVNAALLAFADAL